MRGWLVGLDSMLCCAQEQDYGIILWCFVMRVGQEGFRGDAGVLYRWMNEYAGSFANAEGKCVTLSCFSSRPHILCNCY